MTESPAKYSEVRRYLVAEQRVGQRLDNLLIGELKGVPKTLVYRLIRKGQVRVNGRRCKPGQRLAEGDEVRIPPIRSGVDGEDVEFSQEQLQRMRGRILVSDDAYIVVDKPAGMAVHSGTGLRWGIIDLLRKMPGHEQLELVHRLDRDTSGVLLLARHRPALLGAQQALRKGLVRKRYLCLLHGALSQKRMEVHAPLRKETGPGRESQMVVDSVAGKTAHTIFTVLDGGLGWTFAEVDIKTGRTHQIRVHAAHLHHPLAGDGKYCERQFAQSWLGPRPTRLYLHCVEMEVPASDRTPGIHAHAPLPVDFKRFLESLPR